MRSLLWVLAIALIGGALLLLAWRLVPAEATEGSHPVAHPAGEAPASALEALSAPVEQPTQTERVVSAPVADADAQGPPAELPAPLGLEDGGAAAAARPLPDFGAKYGAFDRTAKAVAAYELEQAIRVGIEALTPAEVADLDARRAGGAVDGAPTPRVAALLEQTDEREWLRQQLALPRVEDP